MPRMDQLDKAIADLAKKIERWARQAEEGRIELAALQKAAKLRPPGASAVRRPPDAENDDYGPEQADFIGATTQAEDGRRPGRRPGAISADWRQVLQCLWLIGAEHTYAEIHEFARGMKIDIKDIASTRDRVRSFVANNLMSGTPETGFTVTEEAAARFGFDSNSASSVGDFPGEAEKVEGE